MWKNIMIAASFAIAAMTSNAMARQAPVSQLAGCIVEKHIRNLADQGKTIEDRAYLAKRLGVAEEALARVVIGEEGRANVQKATRPAEDCIAMAVPVCVGNGCFCEGVDPGSLPACVDLITNCKDDETTSCTGDPLVCTCSAG